ncbi:hypothetical protein [Streptococcus acidominimus]|uniref:Uncharacterized protein n=1 Tax=Streptococcus acidominimus TaxID=1326 RepID=A0A4Y9FLK6_STRAI|nr:hypothetical protein [Streptococcus acidominimus]MBF0819563.1 hypothetical protein [Streptococcus acidominimus]MBF0838998.1 hypothetical protein [Streptococcus acidominimus]MBF0846162.1 hypothetical protein [Streptococcus danieliae]TFU29732.1 hypothetical protein E4U01_08915 [Streptococcus acidominimus]
MQTKIPLLLQTGILDSIIIFAQTYDSTPAHQLKGKQRHSSFLLEKQVLHHATLVALLLSQ